MNTESFKTNTIMEESRSRACTKMGILRSSASTEHSASIVCVVELFATLAMRLGRAQYYHFIMFLLVLNDTWL